MRVSDIAVSLVVGLYYLDWKIDEYFPKTQL